MKELMLALMVWVSGVTGLPVPDHYPAIERRTPEELHYIAYGPDVRWDGDDTKGIQALYVHESNLMLLRHDFNLRKPSDIAILAHELTHHMQYAQDERTYRCKGKREEEAWDVTEKFVTSMGLDFEETMGVNGLFVFFISMCREDMPGGELP